MINEDIGIEKSSLGIRNQKCYAVKVAYGIYAIGLYAHFHCIVGSQWIARCR